MRHDILRPIRTLARRIGQDYGAAQSSFAEAVSNLPLLVKPPIPIEILNNLNLVDNSKKVISIPSAVVYRYPQMGLSVWEARRTFSVYTHPSFDQQAVGLHLFATSRIEKLPDGASDFFYAVSAFQPRHEPFPMLNRAQSDPDIDPRQLITYYQETSGWHQFLPDQLPVGIDNQLQAALRRNNLL